MACKLELSKFDKFIEVKDLQLKNILSIKITPVVIKLDKSTEINDSQYLNKEPIL